MPDSAQRFTSKQRAQLRRMAHSLRPAIHIGKEGVTSGSTDAVEEAFGRSELVKIKVLESAPSSANEVALELSRRIDGVHVVQTMGRVATLYRRHPLRPRIEIE